MSVCSEEENRYTESVSDIVPDEFNNRFQEMVSEDSTVAGSVNNYRKKSSNPNLGDEGYNCVYRKVDGKPMKIDFFETSANPGMYIRDAITGYRLPYKTGTADEDLFYSVRFVTGETKRSDGSNLFYDNPEQYERHFFTTVSPAIKDAWLNKVMNARDIRLRQQQQQLASKRASIVVK